jgi:N4-gp56 family major capsid protein
MAYGYTGPGTLDPQVLQMAERTLLSTPTPQYIYSTGALKQEHEVRNGTTIVYRRMNLLDSFPIPLPTDGSTKPPVKLTGTDISAEVKRYGDWIQLDEETVMFNEIAAVQAGAAQLGNAMRKTEDQLLSALLSSCASNIDATKGGNGDVPTEFNTDDNDLITTMLVNANGHMFLDQIDATEKFGTSAIRPGFLVMSNSSLIPDLERADDFIPVSSYASYGKVLNGEWGAVNNARHTVSTLGKTNANASANGATVYEMAYVAKEAYGMIDQVAGAERLIYHPAWLSDPLETSVSIGVKFYQGQALFNDALCAILKVTLNT